MKSGKARSQGALAGEESVVSKEQNIAVGMHRHLGDLGATRPGLHSSGGGVLMVRTPRSSGMAIRQRANEQDEVR